MDNTTHIPQTLNLADYGSFAESNQEKALSMAEQLLKQYERFHVEHTGDVWVFTVISDEWWKTDEELAYDRLGGGE